MDINTKAALKQFAQKLEKAKALRDGQIAFRFTHQQEGYHCLECKVGTVILTDAAPASPLFEMIGDAPRILAILEGKKNLRMEFLAGGLGIRGDIRYINDLGLELGLLDEPL